ncbi:type VI secretion system ImpA family N-terminal domain-containing protein [Brucella sp. TWI432]
MDPRIFPAARELYYSVKDLCMAARQKEKHGDISPAVHDQWKIIHQKLTQMFSLGCADLELCGWLAEAVLRLEGISGLKQVFHTISQLIETHGTNLHSVESATEMPQYWITPISELSGEGREGVLIQPLRLCALVPGQPYGTNSLWQYQSNIQNRNENEAFRSLSQTVYDAGSAVMHGHRDTAFACIAAYQVMIAQFTELFPDNPPASANLLNILHEYVHAINDLTGFKNTLEQNLTDITATDLSATSPVTSSTHITIINREQALQLLGDVAHFFHQNEPQSPIAPAIETLVRRGRLPFAALLEDLLADDVTRGAILAAAGIHSAICESR